MTNAKMPIAQVVGRVVGDGRSMHFTAYDGSTFGPDDAQVRLQISSPRAMSYLITAPGTLGLARAFVAGDLKLTEGTVYQALAMLADADFGDLSWSERLQIVRSIDPHLIRHVEPPAEEAPNKIVRALHGLRHSKARDAEDISHHYDVSNDFYEWVLGPSWAYTCAVYPTETSTLEEAQFEKFDLVARKLHLEPGQRLLDVGCGWGSMVIHAAKHYGVRALGVTLSRQQAELAQKRIAEEGLSEFAEVRHQDYRDVTETGFDAVSSIGLTEHIGVTKMPAYFRSLHDRLKPGGRLLNHCITRPTTTERARSVGFIDRYVFPDGELTGVGRIAADMQDNGFELFHLENFRVHYAKTLNAWCDNLDAHWDEAVREVGIGRARVWALYMAGSRLGFEQNQIQLHQLLGTRTEHGVSGMPLRLDW